MTTIPAEDKLSELILKSVNSSKEPTSPTNSTSSASSTGIEASGPPTPVFGPPQNFDIVATGIYRSSFPRESNFEYVGKLGLKTIITLVEGPYAPAYSEFLHKQGIKHHQIPFPAHKQETDCIPREAMTCALELLQDASNYPMLIHCNKGKHRTGCAVACYRLTTGTGIKAVIEEYRSYAGVKARVLDEQYIRAFTTDEKRRVERSSSARSSAATIVYPTPPSSDKDGTIH